MSFSEQFMNFAINEMELLKFEGLTRKKWYNSYKYSDKWTKIGVTIGIWLDNSHGNFQLHRFTTSENITKSFRGATFLTHTVQRPTYKLTLFYCCWLIMHYGSTKPNCTRKN